MRWATVMEPARKTGVTRHTRSIALLLPRMSNPCRRQINPNRLQRDARRSPSRRPERTPDRMPVRRIETAPPAFLEYMVFWGLVAAGIAAFIVYLCSKRRINKNAASGSSVAKKKKPRRPGN